MALTKVRFEILDKVDPSRGLDAWFDVQYNPSEYTVTKSVRNVPQRFLKLDSPPPHFLAGDRERLSMELLFDSAEKGTDGRSVNVARMTRKVYQLVKVQPATHAPPRFRITWGAGLSFTAVAESVQQRFTLFSPNGTPLRAVVTLAMWKYEPVAAQLRDIKPQSPDHTKVRVVRRGDTLAAIAGQEYGDVGAWRAIADHNPAVDPRRPEPGTLLHVPPLPLGSEGT